jgi:pimeloyl-ACP methyl ester carboxylesterase
MGLVSVYAMDAEFFTRADGTRIDYFDSHTGDGLLIYHHGTPAAGPLDDFIVNAASANNLRVVELVRPGYGQSTRLKGRNVAVIADIALELADHLGHDKFVSMGWSGGGPHVLASVAHKSGRCVGGVCIAGVGPFGDPELDFLAGMGQDNIEEFGAALESEAALSTFMAAAYEGMKNIQGSEIIAAMASLLPEADRAVLTGEYAEHEAEIFRWAIGHGTDGWFDDDIAFTLDWGFDINDIKSPVSIWQGTEDLMVPLAHGKYLEAKVPNSTAHLLDGHGHLSIGPVACEVGFKELAKALSQAQ